MDSTLLSKPLQWIPFMIRIGRGKREGGGMIEEDERARRGKWQKSNLLMNWSTIIHSGTSHTITEQKAQVKARSELLHGSIPQPLVGVAFYLLYFRFSLLSFHFSRFHSLPHFSIILCAVCNNFISVSICYLCDLKPADRVDLPHLSLFLSLFSLLLIVLILSRACDTATATRPVFIVLSASAIPHKERQRSPPHK